MNQPDERDQEIADLRDRLSRLSQASLRITEGLDFKAVMQAVLDSARSLTGARYAVIALHDDPRVAGEFLASGMTAEEADRLWTMPNGTRYFEHLASIPNPVRAPDLRGYIRSLGLPEMFLPLDVSEKVAFLMAPVFHWGERVGTICLGEKEGGCQFTQEDEDILVTFASQAAMAIANASRYQKERQAKADLETLIDTSPVGVVVLDAETGSPVSLNREARRIIDSLMDPGQTPEMLFGVVTFRRADGREVSLVEFPIAELLSSGEKVRAEEIVLSAPDGRSVTTLLNATPILSGAGVVESVVVTLQDMTNVEEMERMRAEFLAMVSHELRAPLTSIKGSAATALGSASEIEPAVVRQFFHIIEDQADHMHEMVSDLLDVARLETGTLPVIPEPAEVAVLVDRARNSFLSTGANVHFEINLELDLPLVMADRQRIIQVLRNLFNNAARHSSEGSIIRVSAARQDAHVAVSVVDEGRGIPAESLPQLFRKFSQVQSEEYGGDTGLGLAICKGIVEAHGGRIWAESEGAGLGARFTFTLPSVEGALSAAASRPMPSSQREPKKAGDQVRVLAVDDDPQTLWYIRDTLNQSGYTPILTGEPEDALRLVEEEEPQLVLLDLMLPGVDGIDLMKKILELADVPVIFLSAYGREELVAKAFDMGAVDYVVKPFSPTELAARIRAALRRRPVDEPSEPSEPYVLGDLTIDYTTRRVTLAGRPVLLVPMEYRFLAELAANAGRVLSYEVLLRRVWGQKSNGDMRPMRTIVSKLRRKLRDPAGQPVYIFTEPRIGYWMPMDETRTEDPSTAL